MVTTSANKSTDTFLKIKHSFDIWQFSKKFSNKIQLTTPGKYFRKPLPCCREDSPLAIRRVLMNTLEAIADSFFSMKQNVQ